MTRNQTNLLRRLRLEDARGIKQTYRTRTQSKSPDSIFNSLAAMNEHTGAHTSYVRPTEEIFDLESPKIKEVQTSLEQSLTTTVYLFPNRRHPSLGYHSNDTSISFR